MFIWFVFFAGSIKYNTDVQVNIFIILTSTKKHYLEREPPSWAEFHRK